MPTFEFYQVNAFTETFNKGNPAGVVCIPGDTYPEDKVLHAIAKENGFSATAFIRARNNSTDVHDKQAYHFDIRWFGPGGEEVICGHATLGTSHVLVSLKGLKHHELVFYPGENRPLRVRFNQETGRYDMSLGTMLSQPWQLPADILNALPQPVLQVYKSARGDCIVLLEDEAAVRDYKPVFHVINKVEDARGIIITAPGSPDGTGVDFVSRFFLSEEFDVPEDPVTGSMHAGLFPYWCQRLGLAPDAPLTAMQLSARTGRIWGRRDGAKLDTPDDSVTISGHAVTYIQGSISIDV